MKLKVSPEIFERFPGLVLGVVVAHGIDNRGESGEVVELLRSAEEKVRSEFADVEVIDHPHISVWREAYRAFAAKPKKYPSSIESLVRVVLKRGEIRHINKLVDIYNFISLKHLVPVGGEDLDKTKGDIQLCFAKENEPKVLLLGEKGTRPPRPGEVIYKDNVGAICCRFNWKEAERTKFTEETKSAVLVIEGLPPVGEEEVKAAVEELANLVRKYCRGEVKIKVVDEGNPEVTF